MRHPSKSLCLTKAPGALLKAGDQGSGGMKFDTVLASEANARAAMAPGARAGRSGQRLLDLALAIPLLILLSPLLGLIALAVWINDGGPAFYGQTRIGRHGLSFQCWKFRSMVTDSDAVLAAVLEQSAEARAEWACAHKLRTDPRMAEVGRYGARFHDYCTCRPGITGLWQVSGRNNLSYRRRVALDAVYARTASVVLDVAILARTVPAVLFRRGSY